MKWEEGVKDEIRFWETWYQTKGLDWPSDYEFRLNPYTELQIHIATHLVTGNENILDVGAGPLTVLGKNCNGKKLNITACDALASDYALLNETYAIQPIVVTDFCRAENLVEKYSYNSFDIVHAQNCIDHCADPIKAITEMVSITKSNGKVLLLHEVNEAENEGYKGLHQWNFYEQDGCFWISGRDVKCNITFLLKQDAIVKTTINNGHIENIILVK